MNDEEELVTALLLKFSHPQTGWISVQRTPSRCPVSEFVRAFESFAAESEEDLPRKIRRNFGWLRRTVLRCIPKWNWERNKFAASLEEAVSVELTEEHLTNIEFMRRPRSTHRRNQRRQRGNKGVTKPQRRTIQPPPKKEEVVTPQRESLPMKGEIVIGNAYVGGLLGRKGSTIQIIRSRSGARVHLCESRDGRTRTIEIFGERDQVMEAHRQVNQVMHREYPAYLPKGIPIPMRATIELKMDLSLATYLVGMNGTILGELRNTMGVETILQDIEGEETSKLVILTGNIDKILEAHGAVMMVLDTYETWLADNQAFGRGVEESYPSFRPATGDALQSSTALVLQQDGSYKEMQVYIPSIPVTAPPTIPHPSIPEQDPRRMYFDGRGSIRPAPQTVAAPDPSPVFLLPGPTDPNVYYTTVPSSGPLIVQTKPTNY